MHSGSFEGFGGLIRSMADADLTEAAAKVYDRQLRVWGVEVQKRWPGCFRSSCDPHAVFLTLADHAVLCCRLNAARVLIVGCSGLAAEVRPIEWL